MAERKIATTCLVLFFGFLPCFSPIFAEGSLPSEYYQRASSRGVMGETGTLHLIPQGIFVRPFYDDYAGRTDKYLSHETILGWLTHFGGMSLELVGSWRIFTPNFSRPVAAEEDAGKNGVFADWFAGAATGRIPLSIYDRSAYAQFSFEKGEVRARGGAKVHHGINRWVRGKGGIKVHKNDYWGKMPEGPTTGAGGEFGFVWPRYGKASRSGTSLGVGYSRYPTSIDAYVIGQYLRFGPPGISWTLQARAVRQYATDFFPSGLKSMRYEVAFGWRVLRGLTPTLKYISPILLGDNHGQWYLDLLFLNYAF